MARRCRRHRGQILSRHEHPLGRALLGIARYPARHGSYGAACTAEYHAYRLMVTGTDVNARRRDWQEQRRILEYECDVRIHAYLSRLGVFRDTDDLAYELDKTRRKRAVVRRRRCEQGSRAEDNFRTEHHGQREECAEAAVVCGKAAPSAQDCARMDAYQASRSRQRQQQHCDDTDEKKQAS